MKNNIVFKFIAIILCAASLLGAIGSIAGVVVLTEGDLYSKTTEQVKQERIEDYARNYAHVLAREYSSTVLGGSPEQMVRGDGFSMFEHVFSNYGYRILDADGNVLSSYQEEIKDKASLYTYSPTGQYMHLVSLESESDRTAREAQEQIEAQIQNAQTGNSEVPEDGIVINYALLLDADGRIIYQATRSGESAFESISYTDDGESYSNTHPANHAGFLFYNTNGQLVYQSFLMDQWLIPSSKVAEVCFINDEEGFDYRAQDPEGVGFIYTDTDSLRFVSSFTQPAANEPMLVEETVPQETTGWVVETIPGQDDTVTLIGPDGTALQVTLPGQTPPAETIETQPEETVPQVIETQETVPAEVTEATIETTAVETIPSSASAPPEETSVTEAVTEPTAVPETTAVEVTEAAEVTEAVTAPTVPQNLPTETIHLETLPVETEPILINGKTLDNYQINEITYRDPDTGESMYAEYVYLPIPELTVEIYVDETSMRDTSTYELVALVRQYRSYLLPAIGICLFVFAVFAVYLCTAAGCKPKTEEVRAGGLNRLPLDLYLFCAAFAMALCVVSGVESFQYLIRQNLLVGCAVAVGLFFLASLIFVAFCFSFVAQIKTPGGFWWRNTLCGHGIRLFMRFAVWLETFLSTKGFPGLGRLMKKLWNFTVKSTIWLYHAFENSILWLGSKLGKIFRWIGGKLHRFLSLLPLTWQWLLAGFFVVVVLMIGIDAVEDGFNEWLFPVSLLLTFGAIFYASHCFGVLLESTKKMSKGDLDTKVEDKLMVGSFEEFASDLNALADVAVVAAQKQLKSERMKTELITNVSHDIKTPLTSIINYVDLLQKPHTDEEEQQYLEVLDRQSQRLKKLIDDLMDMSKANTGNMQVDITKVDAVESVNQALGEFADKLDKAHLIPVFRHDDARVPMMADGRLVWRVMSNLLSNAVKYAMPGTRLYIDLMTLEGKVIISMKNISREELNIDADELMERFVRGDDSRNTEGSGLGLNIAKSLMDLQKGQLQLLVDGDLFKVTLIFPGA